MFYKRHPFLFTFFSLFIVILIYFMAHYMRKNEDEHYLHRSFYYWKSTFKITESDLKSLERLGIEKLYVKVFDVVWDTAKGKAIPVGVIRGLSPIGPIKAQEIVPTLFITNQVMENLPSEEVPFLGRHILQKIEKIFLKAKVLSFKELQIDCDWTRKTRPVYFSLLRWFKEHLPRGTKLSATIRLHQIKYSKLMGIPPIDSGVLMFYNMVSPDHIEGKNAVLDLEEGKKYLSSLQISPYPVFLSMALPLYSMGVLYQGKRLMGLINGLTVSELKDHSDFRMEGPHSFVAIRNSFIHGVAIYKNDKMRIDESSFEEVQKAASFLASKIGGNPIKSYDDFNVILFHFDEDLIRRIGLENINSIFGEFR